MKKLLSGLLVVTLSLQQVGTNYHVGAEKEPNRNEIVSKKKVEENFKDILMYLREQKDKNSKIEKNKEKSSEDEVQTKTSETQVKKQNILVRLLKNVGKCGLFICKKTFWLILIFLISFAGSAFGFSKALNEKSGLLQQGLDFLQELKGFVFFLVINECIAESILCQLFEVARGINRRETCENIKQLVKTVLRVFHPDNLRKTRELVLSENDTKQLYYLAANASDEIKK